MVCWLGVVFSEEYRQDLEKQVEEDKERVAEEREELQEEAMKEVMMLKSGVSAAAMFGVNTSINTSYASPKPAKPKTEKKKSLFAKKEVKPLVLNPNLSNLTGDFSMPSGSNLDINKGYLNKIKKQLEKREEKQAKKTLSTSLPLSSSQPNNQTIQPLTLSQASGQTNPGSQTAGPRAPGPQTSGPRAPGPPSVREVAAMDRLKGLGLTVSVGQVTKDVSKPTTPAPRPQPLTPQPQQPAPQRPQPQPSQRPQAQRVAPSKAQRGPAPAQRGPAPVQRGPAPAQKGPAPAFSDSQKLQLKSQILAYRLLGRFEAMLPVVRVAATS